ncbi:MAG: glycosyltransferase [Actinobacteria bacterium]|nr:glycosyltransferase [Actinomycetota bacterium]
MIDRSDETRLSVLVVSHTGELGGAERALLRLIAASDGGFDIAVLTMAEGPFVTEARSAGIRVHVLAGGDAVRVTRAQAGSLAGVTTNALGALALARRLRRVIRAEAPDLVVANSLKAAMLVGLVMGRRRWVWHLHDRLASDYLATPVIGVLRLLARFGSRCIVANSRATAATVGRLPAGRVVVAYPGLELSAFERPKRSPGRGPVGIVGRVAPTKGQREFVAAASLVAPTHPKARFRIVGAALFDDAGYAEALHEQIERSRLGGRIQEAGWSASPASEFRSLRMLVHASPVPEPFGQVIVESMAVGTPVVATDAGGVREIVDPHGASVTIADGVRRAPHGLLVRPNDVAALAAAIMWMLDHRAEASTMAREAHSDASARFTIDHTWAIVA